MRFLVVFFIGLLVATTAAKSTLSLSASAITNRILHTTNQIVRRSDGDGGMPDWFDSSCLTRTDFLLTSLTCAPPINAAASQLSDDINTAVSQECQNDPKFCTAADLDKILNNSETVAADINSLIDEVCKTRSGNKNCLQMMTPLIKECVNFTMLDATTQDGITVDQMLMAAELTCTKDASGTSCGAKMIKFSAAVDQVYSGIPCDNALICTAGCKGYLTDLRDELGCCYAEFKNVAASLIPSGADSQTLLPVMDAIWGLCNVKEPIVTCSGKTVSTVPPTGSTRPSNVPTLPTAPGDTTPATSSADSSCSDGSMTYIIIGVAAGGLVLVVVVVGAIIFFRRNRQAGPRYLPVNSDMIDTNHMMNTDDDFEE